jgi:hypothetical protein
MSGPVIVDTTHSPSAQLRPVPINAVTLTDEFWKPRRSLTRELTLKAQFAHLEDTGRLDNFRRAAGDLQCEFRGIYFNDSDVYKWLEGACWALADTHDSELADMVQGVAELIERAQAPDGYLNTYFTFDRSDQRWTNLRDMHELYCAGHFFQAAVAHSRVTGEGRLLAVAQRFADLICETFGVADGQMEGAPGHPEIEMGLAELSRATGVTRYLDQAAYFLNARGRGIIGGGAYHQDHVPFRDADRLTGHAVRALYLAAGATDIVAETGDQVLNAALSRLWNHMVSRQMYITGGLGSRHQGEAIGADYELPNAQAYAETCAGIADAMWAWRMLQVRGDATYADVMERALYNAALPGISLDGTAYFYVNPLAQDGVPEPGSSIHQRQPWFGCACCPPNIARTLAQMPGYLYSVSEGLVWVHTYAANEAILTLPEGLTVNLIQRTRYPWSGQVVLELLTPGEYGLNLRIPDWCGDADAGDAPSLSINNGPCRPTVKSGEYVTVRRTWSVGDTVCIQMPMPIRRVRSHPAALENAGRVALMRGPLLYCLEAVDNPDVDLRDVSLPRDGQLSSSFRKDLLGGVQIITGEASEVVHDSAWSSALYKATPSEAQRRPFSITAVPYYAWANRGAGAMQIWLRQEG